MDPGGPVKSSSADPVKKVQAKTDDKNTESPKVVASGKSNESKSYSLNGG
jgi:hypothetical protein